MKFLSLDLERYGPFTGKLLRFRPDARLHVVYGPNEAGKSSALSSLADLLFGFGKITPYDFIHKTSELRIGAEVLSRNGQRLTFKRRKGNKDTLLGLGGEPLRDNALLPFLGGLTRDVFHKAFGLNSDALRRGAEELLESDAENGAGLFAAASGLHGLRHLARKFEEEADAIFAQRYSAQRKFYQALDRFKDAKAAMARTELRAPAWQALNEEIAQLETRIAEHNRRRDTIARERARLERLSRVAPVFRLLDDDAEKLKAFADLPAYDADAARRIEAALADHRSAALNEQREAERLQRAESDLAAISVEDALLAHEVEIEAVRDLSAYRKFKEDEPRVESEAAGFRSELQALAVRLGLADAVDMEKRQPSDAAKSLVRALLIEGQDLAAELSRLDRDLSADRAALAQMADKDHEGKAGDPATQRRAFAALRPTLTAIAQRSQLATQLTGDRQRLTSRARRLAPPVMDLDAMAAISLPTLEAVARFRKQFDEIEQQAKDAQGALDRANKDHAQAAAALKKMARAGTPPSPETIAAARQRRGRKWSLIADHLSGRRTGSAEDIGELQDDFLASMSEADRLADEALRDAGRVADYAAAELRRVTAEELVASSGRMIADIARERQALAAQWSARWEAAGMEPLTPVEMQTWLGSLAVLIEDNDKLGDRALTLQRIEAEAGQALSALRSIAAELDLKLDPQVTPEALAEALETRLAGLESAWAARRDVVARRKALGESIERKTAQRAQTEDALAAWQTRWREAAAAIELVAGTTRDQAEAALKAWDRLPQLIRDRDDRERRVKGMQRDMQAIEEKSRLLVHALDPGLDRLTPSEAITQLGQRLDRARAAAAKRDGAQKRIAETRQALSEAVALKRRSQENLARACSGYPSSDDLEGLIGRLKQRDDLIRDLKQHREELARAGAGMSETTLREELADFDADDVEAALNGLKLEHAEVVEREKSDHAQQHAKLAQRETLEQGTGAELSAFNRASAEAELATYSHDWLVLKVSQRLIEETIKRHRAGREDVLMQRAGALFSRLTGGAFMSLKQDFDESDRPRLLALRARGGEVGASGMSEGTRDQLYLALRLAFLEDYAAKAEPAPFVADDIFTTFDDARSGNGLEVLAAAGEILQPILFTHHASIVAEAQKRLGAAVEIIAL